jgi:hypothetical protein
MDVNASRSLFQSLQSPAFDIMMGGPDVSAQHTVGCHPMAQSSFELWNKNSDVYWDVILKGPRVLSLAGSLFAE